MFDENHKHNFNKSMKVFIERQLYSDAAHYGLIDTHPTIICGPEATRTHMIATRSGVAGTRGATYVERNRAIYTDIRNQLSSYDVNVLNDDITNLEPTRFIDLDITGTITDSAGNDFYTVLKRQSALPSTKALIYTFSLRPLSLQASCNVLANYINGILGDSVTNFAKRKLPAEPRTRAIWVSEASRSTAIHCHGIATEHTANRIKHLRTYYYNTGGGHMLSGIIIYK